MRAEASAGAKLPAKLGSSRLGNRAYQPDRADRPCARPLLFSELASGMSGVLRRSGFSLVIASSEEDPGLEQQEIDHLLARGVDALLIASTQQSVDTFHRVGEHNIPYILLDRWVPG